MAGSGIWLDDATYLQTAGQIWAQQQQQTVQAGHDWAQQQIADTLSKLQAMVPQVPTGPAPTPAPTPAPVTLPPPAAPPPLPTPAPPPPLPIGGTPVATPTPDAGIAPPAPMPTPTPQAAVVPPPPPAPSMAEAGQNWAQQQIQNLLNPSQPASPSSTPTPDLSAPSPGSAALPSPLQAQGTLSGPQPNAPGDLIDQTRQAATGAGIDPDLFARQINQESGFNPNAGSPAGAQGIAQFMPDTARGLGIDPSDPAQALPAAANLMKSYLAKYAGDWSKALAAYNAGPGNVDKYGGVPPFDETQTYVKNILGGARDVVQQGLSSVNTAVQGVQSAVAARASQFGLGLSSGDAMAFCGPTAAIAFAQTYGRNPTVDEAKQLAQQVGWNPDQGMAGPQSEVSLLKTMGVDAHATSGVDWAQVGRDASGGNPVIIDTPGHYYYVDGYNQQTGQLHVGTSGTDLKGGSEWMTPDQINSMPQSHGGARAAIFADHPLAQQDGLAQSVGRGQNLTMGTMQPAQPDANPLAPYSTSDPYGYLAAGVPAPASPDIGGGAMQLLQQGRDLVGSVLQPDQSAPAPLRAKADSILQAVQDVGSRATQAGADLLKQGQEALQQAPQTVGDILNQNALTSQGIPNIGGTLLEGASPVTGALGSAASNLAGNLGLRPRTPEEEAQADRIQQAMDQSGFRVPGVTDLIPGAGTLPPPGVGTSTPGDVLERQVDQAIAENNPARNVPIAGPVSTWIGQQVLNPTNLALMAGGLEPGRAALELAQEPSVARFLGEESGQLNLGAVGAGPPGGGGAAAAGNPVTWADRARLYHVGNVIGGAATLAKVTMNAALSPLWSFGTRGLADVAGGITGLAPGLSRGEAFGRAAGSLHGAVAGLATSADALAQGLRDVFTNPNSVANRAGNAADVGFGRIWETPGALHNMVQSWGQNLMTHMELGRLAGQEAAGRGLTGQAFINEVSRLIANPLPGWEDSARGVAQRAVLRGDLGTLGQMFGNLAGQGTGGGPAAGARQVIGNVLFPVFRVGMNALTQGVEKSPLGLAGTIYDVVRGLRGAGPYAGGAFEQPLSRAVAPLSERLTNNLAGTALSVWFAKLAADGTVTGNGPTDPDQKKVLEAQGWQPNSIRTPMGYISYQGTPLEVPLGLAGEYADVLARPQSALELAQPLYQTAAERLVAGTMEMLGSRTGLETIGRVWDLMHTAGTDVPTAMKQGGASLVGGIAGSYVPMSATLGSVARATDPLMRQPAPGDIGQSIAQSIPGLREQLEPRVDVLGRTVANPQQALGTLLPARLGAGEENPIAAAMGRAGVAPASVPQTIPYGPANEIRLTPAERTAYEQYRGQVIQQAADALVRSPQWQQLPEYAQRAALQNIDQAAAEAAGRMVLRDIGPSAVGRMVPTGVLAPVQGYQPGNLGDQYLSQATLMRSQAQHAALMQSLLGGQTGLQSLMAANAAAAGVV